MESKGNGLNIKLTKNFKYPLVLKDDKLYVELIPNLFTEARMITAFKRKEDSMPGVRFLWAGKVYDVLANQIKVAI